MSALNRREALLAAGAAGLGAVLGVRGLVSPGAAGAASCLLQREVTEGPYYLDLDLVRRNIKGGRKGTPLTLRFQVVDATTCKPIPNAAVEVWHADAGGAYSGVQGNRGTWLRGIQRTGARGQSDVSNRGDMIYREAGSRALLALRRKGSRVSAGYTGSLVIGVSPSGGR